MKPIQFRWIEAFRAVAATGSTIDTAQVLKLDQSAISRHITALEGQLGVHLFDRRQRNLRLTTEGELLLPDADAAIDALARFQRKAKEVSSLTEGHLQLITSATLARGLLPNVIKAFKQRAKGVTINVEVVARTELEKKIERQQFDLCAVALPFAYPTDHQITIGKFPGVCLVPRRHKLAKANAIRLQDLKNESLVGLPSGTVGRMRIDDLFSNAGIDYKPHVETTAVALNELVAAGIGIAIADPFTARASQSVDFVVRPLKPTIDYEFGLLYPINRPRPALAALFAETTLAQLSG